MIALACGDWRAELLPAVGGAMSRLAWRGEDVLRPAGHATTDPLQTACFPLVPYANRIRDGRFRFEDRGVDLGATPGFEPHALHGEGWRRGWTVRDVDGRSASLVLDHAPSAWPWAWTAQQDFSLDEGGLAIELSVTNVDETAMPAGLGLHPYFPRSTNTELGFEATGVWQVDETLIPERRRTPDAVFDWSGGRRLDQTPFVDHAYAGWDGTARLKDGPMTVTLRASPNADCVHVYAPLEGGFFCVEPVTHRPDALNAPAGEATGLALLQPGETLTLGLTISADRVG